MADMSEDDLLEALHQRMVTTGAWDRLIDKMRSLLTATTYEDDLAAYAQGEAEAQPSVDLAALAERITPEAVDSVPDSIRSTMQASVMKFLQDNLELEA